MENDAFSLPRRVEKHRSQTQKIRLQTIINSKGMKESDFYKSIGLNKDYWYKISWGLIDCPKHLKVKISQALNVDSSILFEKVSA